MPARVQPVPPLHQGVRSPWRPQWDLLAVYLSFLVLHIGLLFGTFDVIDLEELEYGNVAVALLDGHIDAYGDLQTAPEEGDRLSTGAGRRRRTVWSMEPLVLPFFVLFGHSFLALKLCTLALSALWAVAWFTVARQTFPHAGRFLPFVLFAIPLPLVQRSALSATSIFAHLGSSAWHGAALAFVLAAASRAGRSRLAFAAASGLCTGLAFSCSFSVAPLTLGVLLIVLVALPGWTRLSWAGGLLPGAFVFTTLLDPDRVNKAEDFVEALTGLQSGGPFRSAPGIDHILGSLETVLVYGAGFGHVVEDSLRVVYDAESMGYSLGLVAIVVLCTIFGRSKSPPTSANAAPDAPPETQPQDQANQRWVLASFVLSFASFAAVFFGTGFRLDPTFFDGLRYLLPLAPVPALLLLWAGSRTNRPLCWALALLVGGTHLIGTANFFRSEVFPAPWESLTGSEPIVMRTWLRETLRPDSIAESRWPRWARWQGVSDARRRVSEFHRRMNNGEPEPLMAPPSPTAFQGEMLAEYWRGQGLGSLLETLEQGAALTAPTDHRQQERSWFWEGLGLGTAYVGCSSELRAQLLELAWSPPERHALWYGFGRADLYCRSCWQLADARGKTEPRSCCHGEEGTDSCQLGYKDAWRLDYGSGYRYSWTQVIPLDRHRIY